MCFDFFNGSIRVRSHESDHDELLDRLVLWPTLWSHNETNCAKRQILQAPVTVVSISVRRTYGCCELGLATCRQYETCTGLSLAGWCTCVQCYKPLFDFLCWEIGQRAATSYRTCAYSDVYLVDSSEGCFVSSIA